jgi:DMSO/TMAO reductase YedYZ molybdopterin-dependent catalytic subunit
MVTTNVGASGIIASMIKLDPEGFYCRLPLKPNQLTSRVTRTEDVIVLCHLGVVRASAETWSLTIDGGVRRPVRFSLDDLHGRKKIEIASIHQCAGSPVEPTVATRRINSVVWGGVSLSEIIEECQPLKDIRYMWCSGADGGTFRDVTCDNYVKDIPIERLGEDVLLTYEMNYAPLRPENGFPVRLVVPGFYGTNSVKWITRIELAESRANGPFTTRWYNDPVLDRTGRPTGETKPVWSIAPEAIIVVPADKDVLTPGESTNIWGWAWGDVPISAVDVSIDGGETWTGAILEPRDGRLWQKFHLEWVPGQAREYDIHARATNVNGERQPSSSARNSIHAVTIQTAA